MATKDIMSALLTYLRATGMNINQVEAYEGQFEEIDEFVIVPPAAFVALDRGVNNAELTSDLDYYVSIYLCTSHVHNSTTDTMLDLIDKVVAALHNHAIRVSAYTGRCFYQGFENAGIFPNFTTYKLNFIIKT